MKYEFLDLESFKAKDKLTMTDLKTLTGEIVQMLAYAEQGVSEDEIKQVMKQAQEIRQIVALSGMGLNLWH